MDFEKNTIKKVLESETYAEVADGTLSSVCSRHGQKAEPLLIGRWLEGGRGGCYTCMDVRSVDFFCFLTTFFLQLGMVEHWKCGKITIKLKIIIFNLFIRFKKIVPSDLIEQIYNRNNSCPKFHLKQHWYPWSIFQVVLPSGAAKIFQIRKIPRFDKS